MLESDLLMLPFQLKLIVNHVLFYRTVGSDQKVLVKSSNKTLKKYEEISCFRKKHFRCSDIFMLPPQLKF